LWQLTQYLLTRVACGEDAGEAAGAWVEATGRGDRLLPRTISQPVASETSRRLLIVGVSSRGATILPLDVSFCSGV
jgi:hypothetical protein